MTILCILDISPLLDTWFANIISYSVNCLFSLLMVSFAVHKVFGFILAFAFGIQSKQSYSRSLFLCFLLGFV